MSDFVTVAKVGDLSEGASIVATVGERLVAVFLSEGAYYAIDDLCPHMGASLADGAFQSGVVTCPWHAWRFDVRDGRWCDNPKIKIDTFEVRVHGELIQVRAKD
jgi:nitrite reductase (NADH) small subunit/3-phenylpropionate/trans-cinnamate dioxygenase ferredoxin subunit